MNQTHFLVQDKDDGTWIVLDHETYRANQSDFHSPLEIVAKDEEVAAIRHIATQMNLGLKAEKFWKYNAASKVASGGRVGYALLLLSQKRV